MVLPIFVVVVLFVALLVSYPWEVLTAGSFAYLASLPFGWIAYRKHVRADAEAQRGLAPSEAAHGQPTAPSVAPTLSDDEHGERPNRLN